MCIMQQVIQLARSAWCVRYAMKILAVTSTVPMSAGLLPLAIRRQRRTRLPDLSILPYVWVMRVKDYGERGRRTLTSRSMALC